MRSFEEPQTQQPTEEEIAHALEQGDVNPRIFTMPMRIMRPGKTVPSQELLEVYFREVREAETEREAAPFKNPSQLYG